MAERVIVYWRDIPAQVIVRAGRKSAKQELSKRFIEAIDRAAMREGLGATDDYLEQWRRGAAIACGDDLETEADRAAQELEARYSAEVLKALSESGGHRPADETGA